MKNQSGFINIKSYITILKHKFLTTFIFHFYISLIFNMNICPTRRILFSQGYQIPTPSLRSKEGNFIFHFLPYKKHPNGSSLHSRLIELGFKSDSFSWGFVHRDNFLL
ncbi:hypothetical protein L2E82_47485 [Cichorium intybus]|uniref:Uncharacterized protein n=1 Tax=Cichorium intybus TaxID=13427 RepID=A0ACB8YVP7_CICIN|nr:hypothetical protein L2E82_47485 [Cichorium intybus]